MSFQNLNWHSRVEAASRSPLIAPQRPSTRRPDRTEPNRTEPSNGTTTRPGGDRQEGTKFSIRHAAKRDFSGAGKPEPRFLWAKAARSAALVVLLLRHCHDEDEPKFPQVSASANRGL